MEMRWQRDPNYVFTLPFLGQGVWTLWFLMAVFPQVVYKLPTESSWCFDVQWCPQDPSVFSAASFDGWISLYSVMEWSWEVQHMRQADKV